MAGHLNPTPISSNDPNVLDVKPLRTLMPMFPAPLSIHTHSSPNAPSYAGAPPFGNVPGHPSSFQPPCTTPAPQVKGGNGIAHSGKGSPSSRAPPTSSSGRSSKRSAKTSSPETAGPGATGTGKKKKAKREKPERIDGDVLLLASSSSDDPREMADVVLMTYDALRRRLMQIEEARELKRGHVLKAGSIMLTNDLRVNKVKKIGTLPGIEVGDMFYFRIEMCLVGLNSQTVAGIDYMTVKFEDGEDPVALCVVSSGVYENTEDDVDVLIYNGQGLSSKDDQKLERGNLALERSMRRGNEIRVVRSVRDYNCPTGKIYIYDGLYKIRDSWTEKAKSGFNVFKYKFVREPDQPDGIVVWKMTEKWRDNPSSRGKVILPDISSGMESRPVCLVNDVDDEKGPSHFTYATKVNYMAPLNSMKSLQGCMCSGVCLPGDASCSCAQQNGDELPYSARGILISRKPLLTECTDSCKCSVNCRNRVTQKGVQLHFEVFKTRDRGWGLHCWDPIRAGTFICEYTGEVVNKAGVDEQGEDDEYIFHTLHADQKFRWNYIPELLGESSPVDSTESSKPLPIIISAKNMGNISRFMNHSCAPNVFWQPVLYDHGDGDYPHIMFFAIKHIPPMTELTYDYGLFQTDAGNEQTGNSFGFRKTKKCLCGSSKCRGSFG